MKGLLIAIAGIFLLHIGVGDATVIGHPTVELPGPGNAVLTGITRRFDEPNFMRVNKSIDEYLGVPYAVPPLGDLRFADSLPYDIQGSYDATRDRPVCYQTVVLGQLPNPIFPGAGQNVSEDCLYLSIYTPSPKPVTPVPVMVWIHGGGYVFGAGSQVIYEPLPLVALADIIVVNVNYRMGVFGFMTTGDDVSTGNYGLMDALLALQWIKTNIAAFGGNPESITISGESAGSYTVGHLIISPLSVGLFDRAIMQSGSPVSLRAWLPLETAADIHRAFAQSIGCPTESQAMVDCMRAIDADQLQRQEDRFDNGSLAEPVVDGHFIPDDPIELVKRRQFQVVPTLIGTTRDEWGVTALFLDFPTSLFERPTMNISYWRSEIPDLLFGIDTQEKMAALEQQYIDWSVADDPTGDQLDAYIRVQSDQFFICPTEYFARALEAVGAEVYRYEMTHDPAWSVYAGIPQWTGPIHAEDLPFVFAWGFNPTIGAFVGQTDEEKFMSIEFMRYWTNFVISGNPNEPMTSNDYPEWPRYTMPAQEYKDLSLNMTNRRAMRAADCSFWLNLMPQMHLQTAPMQDLYEDWQIHYERWRDTDVPNWTTEFDQYKGQNTCPLPSN